MLASVATILKFDAVDSFRPSDPKVETGSRSYHGHDGGKSEEGHAKGGVEHYAKDPELLVMVGLEHGESTEEKAKTRTIYIAT